jgi:hypothetical protein
MRSLRMSSKGLVTAGMLLVGACSSGSSAPATETVQASLPDTTLVIEESSAATPYDRFNEAVGENQPSPQQALDWFVSLTGIALPGARASFGAVTGPVTFSDSLRLLADNWSAVTDEQRAAVRAALAPSADAPAGVAASSGLLGRSVAGVTPVDPALAAMVDSVNREVAALMGTSVASSDIVLRAISAELVGTAHAEANSDNDFFGVPLSNQCTIVYGRLFSSAPLSQQRALLAHEISHCHLYTVTTNEQFDALPRWYAEGSAAWIGEVVGGGSGVPIVGGWWGTFLRGHPVAEADRGYSFFRDTLGYSAIGLFQWAAERQGQATVARGIAANVGLSTEAKLESLFGSEGSVAREAALTSFATAPIRRPYGAGWNFAGIGLASFGLGSTGRMMADHSLTTTEEFRTQLAEGSRIGAAALTLTPAANIDLVHITTVGHGAVTWEGAAEVASVGGFIDQVFCIGEACRCADSLRGRSDVRPVPDGVKAVIALASDTGMPMRVAAKGYALPDGSCDPCPVAGPARATHGAARPADAATPAPDPLCGGESTTTVPAPDGAGCVVGIWVVDNEAMVRAFQAVTAVPGAPPGDQQVTGSFAMQVNADGTMTITVAGWTVTSRQTGPEGVDILFEAVFDGSTAGTWSATDSTFSTNTTGSYGGRSYITVAGVRTEVTGGMLPSLPIGAATSNAVCTDAGLTLRASGAGAIDMVFVRTA